MVRGVFMGLWIKRRISKGYLSSASPVIRCPAHHESLNGGGVCRVLGFPAITDGFLGTHALKQQL